MRDRHLCRGQSSAAWKHGQSDLIEGYIIHNGPTAVVIEGQAQYDAQACDVALW